MKALMIHVERAVRPVRAGGRRKLAMRYELLAHLTAIYDEEKARHPGDEPAALRAALARFGEPAQLTKELQETVPYVERFFNVPLTRPGRMRPSGAPTPYFAAKWAALYAVVNLVSAVPFWAARGFSLDPFELVMLTAIGATAFLLAFLCLKMVEAISPDAGPRSWPKAAGFATLAFAVQIAASALGSLYLYGDLTTGLGRLPQACAVIAVVLVGFAAISVAISEHNCRLRVWLSLEIGD